jgi:hypothetical protein
VWHQCWLGHVTAPPPASSKCLQLLPGNTRWGDATRKAIRSQLGSPRLGSGRLSSARHGENTDSSTIAYLQSCCLAMNLWLTGFLGNTSQYYDISDIISIIYGFTILWRTIGLWDDTRRKHLVVPSVVRVMDWFLLTFDVHKIILKNVIEVVHSRINTISIP